MIIAAARASAVVVTMDGQTHLSSLVRVEPHTATHLMVVFTGLPAGCVINRGCTCYRWGSVVHAVRFPPQQPNSVACHNLSTTLQRASAPVVPAAALLPLAEIPIAWHLLRNVACRDYGLNPFIAEAVMEGVLAASVVTTEVCLVAGSVPGVVTQASRRDSHVDALLVIVIMLMVAAALLMAGIHVYQSDLPWLLYFKHT